MEKSIVSRQDIDYRKLFESLTGLYLILSNEFNIIDASNGYLQLLNTSKNKLVGKSIFSIIDESNNDSKESTILKLSASFKKIVKNKITDSLTVECPIENADDNKQWKIINHPILSEENDVVYILHQLEEITTSEFHDFTIAEPFSYNQEEMDLEIDLNSKITELNSFIKILLVDDREDNLFSLKELLSIDGYTLQTAKSGTEALKILLRDQDFTLIIMDVQMPILNGIETASLIYEREKLKHIPIIFITASEFSESILFQGYKTGGVDYIYKPINSNLLRAKVAVFVELFKKNHLLLEHERRLRNAAQLLKSKNNLLANSNSELSAFTYSISHDLRVPLRAIEGYSKILHEDYHNQIDESGLNILNQIVQNTHKMTHLIEDLLHLSKVSRKELKKKEVDMEKLIHSTLIELRTQINNRKIDFKFQNIFPAKADENLIKQVWMNLLSNAIKYTRLNKDTSIEIGSNEENNYTVYFIKDNGIGFDMNYADKVFSVFQRLHSEKDFEGTGIGLAIVKRIVQKHSGKVWVQSTPNKGTTFYFSLPTE